MSSNYLEQAAIAKLARIEQMRLKEVNDLIDQNPRFLNRFEAINEMFSNLPVEITMNLAQFSDEELPIDSQSIVDLNDNYIEQQSIQVANAYEESKKEYQTKDFADNMTFNYIDVLTFGGFSSALWGVNKLIWGSNYVDKGGEVETPIGVIDFTPSAPILGKTQTGVLIAETFNAMSDIFVRYSPSYRSSIEKPQLIRDKETDELVKIPGSKEFENLNPLEKVAMGIPGVNLLVPGNRALFNNRILAYAQQLNALDRYMETGKTKEWSQQYVPIDFADTKVTDLGYEGNWIEETKAWLGYANEARKRAGKPVIAQIHEEVVSGRPVNFNRDNVLIGESMFAEDSAIVADMVQKGFSFEESAKAFYEDNGRAIIGRNNDGEIHWNSLVNPNEIKAFAGRQFIYTPEAAEQYEQVRQRNQNELLGIQIPYSSGRYQASLLYDVGSNEYNQLSGLIDGSERIIPEIIFNKGIKFAKKLQFLTKNVNKLESIDDASLYSHIKKREMISEYVTNNKVNPLTGKSVDNIDEFLNTFDYATPIRKYKKYSPELQKQIKSSKRQTAQYKKDYGLFGGRANGIFNTTGPKIANSLRLNGNLNKYTKLDNSYKIATDNFIGKFPEAVQKEIKRIKNIDEMEKLFTKIYSDAGVKLPRMDMPFKLTESPLRQSKILSTGVNKLTGKNIMMPSAGSLIGRGGSKALNYLDNVARFPTRAYKKLRNPQKKMELTNINKTLSQDEFRQWNKTGNSSLARNMGFFHEFTDGMSYFWKKWFSLQPNNTLSYANRGKAFTTLVRHLSNIGYPEKEAGMLIDEFQSIPKWTVQTVNDFARKLKKADVKLIAARKGEKRSQIVQRRIDLADNSETQLKNYIVDPLGRQLNSEWTGTMRHPETGETIFIPTISKLSEAADNGASLNNNRMLQRTLGRLFTDLPDTVDDVITPQALKKIKDNIKEDGFFKGLKIPSRKIEEDIFTWSFDQWNNNWFKPRAILKPSLTERVLLEEQIGFFVHPTLDSIFDHPFNFTNWMYSYGQLPKRAPIRKVMEKIINSGEDVNEITMSVIYHEALGININRQGFNTRNMINKSDINYVPVSSDHPKALDGYIFQHLKLRNDPITRVVARLGWSDSLMEWAKSPDGIISVDGVKVKLPPAPRLIQDLIDNTGDTYRNLRKNTDKFINYLAEKEGEIRFRTGMPTQVGVHWGEYTSGAKAGTHWYDNSFSFSGSNELRESIWTGIMNTPSGKTVKLAPSYDNLFENFGSIKKLNMKKGYKEFIDEIIPGTEDKLFDFGKALIPDVPDTKRNAEMLEKYDYFLDAQFEFLLTQPLAMLHRSTTFKQYRWLRLSSHFEMFTPKVQQKFIDEAVTAAIPNKVIKKLKDIKNTTSGKIDDFEIWSKEASSYALSEMKSILYDASERHRFSEVFRNAFPFPEIFFELGKRWSKLSIQNPYFIRQAGLVAKANRAVGGTYTYSGQGSFHKDKNTGEDMFLMPMNNSFNNFLFGEDSTFRTIMKGFSSGVNMIASQGFPNTNSIVAFGAKLLFDKTPASVELTEEFFGEFPPPDNFMDALKGGDIAWLQKTSAALKGSKGGLDLITETLSDTWLDDDLELQKFTMDSKVENMRADSTITVFDGVKESHSEIKLLESGELDKYIKDIFVDWNGERKIFEESVDALAGQYLDNNNLPIDVPKGVLTPAVLDLAIMRYAAHQGRWLNLFRAASQFGFLTGAMYELVLEDKNGKWFGVSVLANEHQKLVEKHAGDYQAAGKDFFNTFGINHSYILETKKQKGTDSVSFDAKVIQWQKNNRDELKAMPNTLQFLKSDNPLAEQNWQDVVERATLNPRDYIPNANNASGYVMFKNFKEQLELNTNLSTKEKELMSQAFNLALMDLKPGYRNEFGQTETPSTITRFNEMRDVWRTNTFAQSTEAGQGFKYFYENFWSEAEKISVDAGYSTQWWRTSKTEDAQIIRKQVAQAAYYTIGLYPEFYPVYMNVIIRLMSNDSRFMNYNTALNKEKIDFGTQITEPPIIGEG
tara:strand:+ start:945 stop:6980 length:6036 start_codon:yes stop_codon:yes gene_type:complete